MHDVFQTEADVGKMGDSSINSNGREARRELMCLTSALIIIKAASSSSHSYIKDQTKVHSSLKSSVIYSLCLFNGQIKKPKNDAFRFRFSVICTA